MRAIATDPRRPGRITVGTQDGIHRSEDHGEHWVRLAAPAPGLAVWSLLVHPSHLYCASKHGEVFVSRDHGNSWQAHPLPAGATQVYSLAVGYVTAADAAASCFDRLSMRFSCKKSLLMLSLSKHEPPSAAIPTSG